MVKFETEYRTPMDRDYHEQIILDKPPATIEEPVIPIAQIGQTVPEHDLTGRYKNIIQNVQAAIRAGTGNIQLVMQTPIENPIGGRPKAYGKEVRQALKELSMANETLFTGVEMPTSLSNLSGYDREHGRIDEAKRLRDVDEVKEAIKFAAEVGQGGGVDVLSWEHERPLHRATWWKPDSPEAKAFKLIAEENKKKDEIRFVDTRSGQILSIPVREGIPMFIKKDTFEKIDPLEPEAKPEIWTYDDFEKYSKLPKNQGKSIPDLIKENFLNERHRLAEAQEAYYKYHYEIAKKELAEIERVIKEKSWDPEKIPEEFKDKPLEFLEQKKKEVKRSVDSYLAGLEEQKKQQLQAIRQIESLNPLEKETLNRCMKSYAEAGIEAMRIQDKMGPKQIRKDLYVGPEIGWPQFYGSHPKEFAELILGARKIMTEELIKQGFTPSMAKEEARRHIKGMLDTSHVGMWLQNFHPELPWDERVKKFNKWYTEQMEWLADLNKKEQIIGGIQAVDSAGAGHGHLPPGQGILPVKKAIEILKQKGGFTGYITSEGHEEEKFGEGRILMKTWQHFDAPITSTYGHGMPVRRWGDIRESYFGRTYSPLYMFGAYAPSNEFKLWSEVPLE
ncbi:MAG: hypothetical protein QXR48_04280 [Candidatus Woesearchaeota archaeon]